MTRNIHDWMTIEVASFALGFEGPEDMHELAHTLLRTRTRVDGRGLEPFWGQAVERNARFGEYVVVPRILEDPSVGVVRYLRRDAGLVADASLWLRSRPGERTSLYDTRAVVAHARRALAAQIRAVGGGELRDVATVESTARSPRLETMRLAIYRSRSAGWASGTYTFGFAGEMPALAARVRAASAWSWEDRQHDDGTSYLTASPLPPPHDGRVQLFHDPVDATFVAEWRFGARSTSDTPCNPRKGYALVEAAHGELRAMLAAIGSYNVR